MHVCGGLSNDIFLLLLNESRICVSDIDIAICLKDMLGLVLVHVRLSRFSGR